MKAMNSLIDRMQQNSNEMLFKKDIHENLSYASIVDRVKMFIQNLEASKLNYAYGITDFDDPHLESDDVYDPIVFLKQEPEKIELIQHMVAHDIEHHLNNLLLRKEECIHSYNILVFGCAIYVANAQQLPEKLQSFLVDHLLNPSVDLKERSRGRGKRPGSEISLIGSAVSFAKQHGLKATRNDASRDKSSACDAVAEAVAELMQEKRTNLSCSSYGAVQKVWQKYKKSPV